MKIGVLAAAAALLVVSGCGSSSKPSADDQFISKLGSTAAFPSGVPDASRPTLISMAHRWCDYLDTPGRSRSDVRTAMAKFTASLGDREQVLRQTVVLGTASQVYCPAAAAKVGSR